MWFGTRERMTWIPCPAINAGLGSTRWIATGQFLNGGAYQRQSAIGRNGYSFSWNPQEAEGLYELLGYFDGIHGTGPFYFIDPFAEDSNVLPSYVASPSTMSEGAPSFGGAQRVNRVLNGTNQYGYPAYSGQFSVAPNYGPYKKYTIPVPPGHNLHFGAHGSASGTAAVTLNGTNVPMLTANTPLRTNTVLPGNAWYDVSVAGTGVLTLAGLIAQILPVGRTPKNGNFIPGRGHSGVRLAGDPQVTGYSAALTNASVGMTAEFVETGAWEQ